MHKRVYLFCLLSLLLLGVGCGGTETAVPTDADTDGQAVAAKPQLVEFYADW